MLRRRALLLAAAGLLLVSGCGRSFLLEQNLVALCKGYTENVAERKFDKATEALTGDALESMQVALPMLQAMQVSSKISDWQGKVDFVNRAKDRASVEAHYLMEQTVEGFGTTLNEFDLVFDLKKLGGVWKIYSVKTIKKQEKKG